MLIEDMLNKRDVATNLAVVLQNSIGKDRSGVFMPEDFERRSNSEFREYCISEMKRLNLKSMIFCSWAFTKEYYNHLISYERFENEDNTNDLIVLIFPEINSLIVCINNEELKYILSKISNEFKKLSTFNIKSIEASENGIEINYFTNTAVRYFEEKPKSIEEIIKEE